MAESVTLDCPDPLGFACLSIHEKSPTDKFAMHRAAKDGDVEGVRQLILKGVPMDIRDRPLGRTPLRYAAENGRYEVAELLISSKCDLNLKSSDSTPPVIAAARKGRKDIVLLLLQHGAQVDIADFSDLTLLHWACIMGFPDVVVRILEKKEAEL